MSIETRSFSIKNAAPIADLHAPAPFLLGSGAYSNDLFMPPSERTSVASPPASSTSPTVELVDNSFYPPHTYASVRILSSTINLTTSPSSATSTVTTSTTETKPMSYQVPFDSTYAQISDVPASLNVLSPSTKHDAIKPEDKRSTIYPESGVRPSIVCIIDFFCLKRLAFKFFTICPNFSLLTSYRLPILTVEWLMLV